LALVGAMMLPLVFVGCGLKKKGPMPVVVSCDLRGAPKTTDEICMDVVDKGFVSNVQPICLEADPTGKRWHQGVACDRTGALGACRTEGVALVWHYPSAKEKTADDVKKACTSTEKFVRSEDEPSTQSSAVATATAAAAPTPSPLAKAPDLGTLLGTKAEGWLPRPFAALKKNMTLPQVTKVMPWATKLDAYGTVETSVKDVLGVSKYRLRFVDRQLFAGEIVFDPSLHNAAFRSAFIAAAKAKWGDPRSTSDTSVIWFSPTSAMATFEDAIGGGYEINFQI
jgi:hypothetical protein